MASGCSAFAPPLLLLLSCLQLSAGLQASRESSNRQCGHPDYRQVCFENSVRSKLVFNEFEPVVIRCVVRNLGRHVVTWMKNDGRDIPLTIGRTVFSSDKRVKIDYSSPDEWNLVIQVAEVKDSGEYLCQVNTMEQLEEKRFQLVVKEGHPGADSDKAPNKSGVRLNDDKPVRSSKSLQNDEAAVSPDSAKAVKSVNIYGPRIVLHGDQFVSLTCSAVFRSSGARRNPDASVEWYHQGLQQRSNASSMDISMSWKDGDTTVSVLTIYSVRFEHSGDWVCLKQPSERAPALETASHHLTVLEWDPRRSSKSEQLLHHQQQQQQQQRHQQLGHKNSASVVSKFRMSFASAAMAMAAASAAILLA